FRHGKIIRKVPEATMVEELKKEIDAIAAEKMAEREREEQELANQSN
ncbi:MAG: 4-hydroxy-3-methylbut-2-en-1-yl diphosphate synthase, partial [Exiguobacterium sp.]|nr:4-hydroxy-3-methylbut-2-en-1-yl diphosphate synthase [Exiguobacterium sp.]